MAGVLSLNELRFSLGWLSPGRLRAQLPKDRWVLQIRAGIRDPGRPFVDGVPHFWNLYAYVTILGATIGAAALFEYRPLRRRRK